MSRLNKKTFKTRKMPNLKGQYEFLKYQIEINDLKGDLFNSDTTLNTNSESYPTLWHEYTHYIQNVATSIGVRIFLNWIGVLVKFSENAARSPILQIPMSRASIYDINTCLIDFNAEYHKLIGLQEPLDRTPPEAAQPFTTYINPSNGRQAFLCMEEEGQKVGVPLSGNLFVESMAQAVQWLSETQGEWSDDLLAGKSILTKNAYYFALFKYFRHITPQLDPCIPVLCVSETALQTINPAVWFCYLEMHAFNKKLTEKWWQVFANTANQCSPLVTGLQNTLEWLNKFEVDNKEKKETQFMQLALSMADFMKINLTNRLSGISLIRELIIPTPESFVSLCNKCKCPPIYTKTIENGFMFNATQSMTKFCSLNFAFFDLVYGLNSNGLTTACPLLHTRICSLKKDKKTYCQMQRLVFPTGTGSGCPMEVAALLLSVWNKPTVTIR